MAARRLVGIASAHTVRVLDETGETIAKRKCYPTVDSLAQVETAALAGTGEGTRLEVIMEPTGPAWLPIAVFFARRGHRTPACGTTALGSCLGSDVGRARAGESCDQHPYSPQHPPGVPGLAAMPRSIRHCVRSVCCQPGSPRLTPFPPPPPQPRPCSTGSLELRGDTTSHLRASQTCGLSLPWAARPRSTGRANMGSPGSRTLRFRACTGSLTQIHR